MKISIGKFQELYNISQIEGTEVEKSMLLVQCLTGKTQEQVDAMPEKKRTKLVDNINGAFQEFNKQTEKSKSKSIIKLNGNWYRLNYNLAKPPMNAGKYVEIATFSQDIIGNMNRIMATMCTPVKFTFKGFVNTNKEIDHSKLSDEMLDYDFAAAYQSCVFFYAVFSKSIQNSPIYFKSITPMKNQMETILMNLHEVMVGYITQRWFQNLKISA
jgi:hypothetical protein